METETFQFQQDDDVIIQKTAAHNDSSASISNDRRIESVDRLITKDREREHINTADDTLIYEFTNREQYERVGNSVCSKCWNKQPRWECHRDFTYAELHAATDGFSKQNFLSEGGFGSVYKGRLKDGQQIAVKQHKPASLQGEKECRSEVNVLSKARHENVVMLLGSCSEGNHRLLVYEYICNGSLDIHLSSKNNLLALLYFPPSCNLCSFNSK